MIAASLKILRLLLIIVIVFPFVSCSAPFGKATAKATNNITAAKTTALSELTYKLLQRYEAVDGIGEMD